MLNLFFTSLFYFLSMEQMDNLFTSNTSLHVHSWDLSEHAIIEIVQVNLE